MKCKENDTSLLLHYTTLKDDEIDRVGNGILNYYSFIKNNKEKFKDGFEITVMNELYKIYNLFMNVFITIQNLFYNKLNKTLLENRSFPYYEI